MIDSEVKVLVNEGGVQAGEGTVQYDWITCGFSFMADQHGVESTVHDFTYDDGAAVGAWIVEKIVNRDVLETMIHNAVLNHLKGA